MLIGGRRQSFANTEIAVGYTVDFNKWIIKNSK